MQKQTATHPTRKTKDDLNGPKAGADDLVDAILDLITAHESCVRYDAPKTILDKAKANLSKLLSQG